MAKFSSIYKQTAPTRRTVNGENTYEKGMMWSNQALMPGYTRTLLNFEIDTLTGALTIPGGFHTTDVAAGCTFIDNAIFDSGTEGQVIVLQGRNEYCLRAFEGITNIISVQRLSIKNNQTLAERLRQQGFTADDVTCYKLLTYNPINHRLMSVTLIKAPRDKYFTLDEELFLRRLNVNPISCGFSEVWDRSNMQHITLPHSINWQKVIYAYDKRRYFAIAYNSSYGAYSDNGIEWNSFELPYNSWSGIAYNGLGFVAVARNSSKGAHSIDGITWTETTLPAGDWVSVTSGYNTFSHNPYFIAVANNSANAAYSLDGITWTTVALPLTKYWTYTYYSNTKLFALATLSSTAIYTGDGINWTTVTLPGNRMWSGMTFAKNKYVVIAKMSSKGAYSADGITWTEFTLPAERNWSSVTYGNDTIIQNNEHGIISISNGFFVAVAEDSKYGAYSLDGITWKEFRLPSEHMWQSIVYGADAFVVVATNNTTVGAYFQTLPIYVSNKLDYHPEGAEDNYIPRVRRNKLNETFGQTLHSPLHMQTVAHCEGFGNKTFVFTKKKQTDLTGPIVNQTPVTFTDVYHVSGFSTYNASYQTGAASLEDARKWRGNWGHAVNDIINIYTTTSADNIENLQIKVLSVVTVQYYVGGVLTYTIPGVINSAEFLSTGTFKWTPPAPHASWTFTTTGTGGMSNISISSYNLDQIVNIGEPEMESNYQYDTYFGNMHTGLTVKESPTINSIPVPVDAYRFGIALTSLGIKSSLNSEANPTTISPISATDLWDKAVANKVEAFGKSGTNAVIGIDLNTGLIKPAVQGLTTGSYLEIVKLPVLTRSSEDNDTPLTDLFKSTESIVKIENWDDSKAWFHPADLLLDNVNNVKRIGQGIRLAAYCKVLVPLTRYLKTLSENPFDSDYYTSNPTAVFVLDYVWNGKEWEFSFVDTRYTPTEELPNLTENWDRNGTDSLGNRIARHYIWVNNLSYTDIITEENVGNMPKHIVDTLSGLKTIAKKEDGELLGSTMDFLDVKLDETLDDRLNVGTIKNKSKIFDTSYGHFEVTPKTLTPAEAAKWGYNMLSPTPYVFECLNTPASEPQLTGILLMRNGQPLLKPVVNTPGTLYIYFNAAFDVFAAPPVNGEGYQLTVEYKNIYDEWRTLKEFSTAETHILFNAGKFIEVPFSSPDETVLIRATITNRNETVNVALSDGTTEDHYVVSSQLITTLSYAKDPSQSNVSPKIYDIGSALGMTYWKGRLVAWGVLNAESTLFLSEPNEPEYFAYPNGIDLFEENIVHVIPYSDALIVFTSTKLWRLDMLTDGLSWSKTLLQQNLRIIDKDIPYITVLKNMLFFKSDKQFYMLVPARSGTVGELTIAPISKAIQDFLTKPFDNLRDILRVTYPEMCSDNPINNYLVKYGAHSEQSKVFVDWWFNLTAWQNASTHIGDSQVDHDVFKTTDNNDNPSLLEQEYWLVQLVYDVQTYSWTIRTHTSPTIGVFVTDAANIDTDFVSLVFSPEPTVNSNPIFVDTSEDRYAKATWGVSISHRRTTNDSLLQAFTLGDEDNITLAPAYPRFQIFDTGYKEVSTPALKKHFREIQFTFEPREASQTNSDGDSVGIRAVLLAQIDGHTVMSAVSQEITEELQEDGTLIIKVVDQINYHNMQLSIEPQSVVPLPYLMDSELSNTFVLESSALSGVKNVKVRRAINGKGQLIRMRFTNITESNYAIISHAFVSHNKNAR